MNPVVDAHHHIWRQADLPWLQGPMVPRIFGPYEAIRRENQQASKLRPDDVRRLGRPQSDRS